MIKSLITLLLSCMTALVYAQDSDRVEAVDPFAEFEETVQVQEETDALDAIENTISSYERSEEFNKKLNEYSISSLDHRKAVFAWQLFANKLIFVFVMLIVLSGLILSYMHFYKSLKAPAGEGEKTELEMSTSGIKMNSSVIGLIILVLAIAFLYLYLIHVFPINEFNVDTKAVPELTS